MLHGYTQLYSPHKNRRYLRRHSKNVEARFDTSNYEIKRQLTKGKNKKVIGLIRYELEGKILTLFATLKTKTCSYLTIDKHENKKLKCTKKFAIKRKLMCED